MKIQVPLGTTTPLETRVSKKFRQICPPFDPVLWLSEYDFRSPRAAQQDSCCRTKLLRRNRPAVSNFGPTSCPSSQALKRSRSPVNASEMFLWAGVRAPSNYTTTRTGPLMSSCGESNLRLRSGHTSCMSGPAN